MVCPRVIFQFYHHREKKSRYQQKSPRYQPNLRYQPKKRRYLYNSVYGSLEGRAFIALWGINWVTSLRIGQRRGFLGVTEFEEAGKKKRHEEEQKRNRKKAGKKKHIENEQN